MIEWTPERDDLIQCMLCCGFSTKEIANALHTTEGAIFARFRALEIRLRHLSRDGVLSI